MDVARRGLGLVGIVGAAACLALVGVLHVVPPSSLINPWRRAISEYALHVDADPAPVASSADLGRQVSL